MSFWVRGQGAPQGKAQVYVDIVLYKLYNVCYDLLYYTPMFVLDYTAAKPREPPGARLRARPPGFLSAYQSFRYMLCSVLFVYVYVCINDVHFIPGILAVHIMYTCTCKCTLTCMYMCINYVPFVLGGDHVRIIIHVYVKYISEY